MSISLTRKMPVGDLGIIVMNNCRKLGDDVNRHLMDMRGNSGSVFDKGKDSYILSVNSVRFANGEGKVTLEETVRGKDLYILTDVGNYSCTYKLFGMEHHMGPDEHFQDIKRVLSAIGGHARRISVIMPLLYSGRQHKRKGRESLDCALALQELERLGVKNIITFDAHDPRVENAVPLIGFSSLNPTYEITKALLETEKDLIINKSSMVLISPDTGAMDKAVYYASVLGVDVGLFYKRRDYTTIINGKNPIIQHEYLGGDIQGKDVLIVDDMIASGESIFDIINQLKRHNARNIYIAVTFGMFTEGIAKFNKYYEQGLFRKLFATNLTYIPEGAKKSPWFKTVDMSECISRLIDTLNYDESISPLSDATPRIKELLNSIKK